MGRSNNTINVLLVEDNPGDAFLIRQILQSASSSIEVSHCESLEDALFILEENAYNIILLDLSLPDSFGLETLRSVYTIIPRTPIIVLTGLDDIQTGLEAMKMGAEDYLTKDEANANSTVLIRTIHYAIERASVRAALQEHERTVSALQERQRLARELHDSVTQMLFTSNVLAESILRQWEPNPEKAHDLMQQLHSLTSGALLEMRILLLELRPASLTQVNLRRLLEQLAASIHNRYAIPTSLQVVDVPMLPPEVQLAFYRIAQEAMNNIVKHASATLVRISLTHDNGQLMMQMADNGHGFDETTVSPSSLGLNIMKERAEEIQANLTIETALEQGTQITVLWNYALSEPMNGS